MGKTAHNNGQHSTTKWARQEQHNVTDRRGGPGWSAHCCAVLWSCRVSRVGDSWGLKAQCVRNYAPARVAMALSKLRAMTSSGHHILGQLRNTLEPRLARHVHFSSASKELRALLTPAVQQQLRADYEEATALCLKVGMRDCKELREATIVRWRDKGVSAGVHSE